ncbi:MAG TPA: S8 family serine peptidase [Gemmatimonadales bacterium]
MTGGPADGRTGRFGIAALLAAILGCSPAAGPVPTTTAPVPEPAPVGPSARPPLRPEPSTPPADAALLGLMPLGSTNVLAFRSAYPRYDGRGVLVAVLDGGVDPVAGLQRLPDGGPKLIDQRDFSGEGRIALAPARFTGDTVFADGVVLRGAARLRGLTSAPVFAGRLAEIQLGEPPAADLDGNGHVGDTLAVAAVRIADGWAVLADTDGDGSLANERPVRDYAVARETFAWNRGRAATTGIAVNLEDRGDGEAPLLDLVFDTSAHGTHVAGIAAGHALYGVGGFDGVAPGAEILSVKIANNAHGGITRTGSMLRGIDYAIRTAARRRQPLVINISYGVGNEAEGKATIDALVDSVLAAHPAVVMTISAGNDGPGISTLGFPGSARRPLSVGATYPGAFLPMGPGGRRYDDMVAFFSARGGEVARPDLVAPGLAYSTVPGWDIGEEVKNGTSMAAPHVAGLAALLMSGLTAEGRPVDAALIKRALVASARPLLGATVVDQGAGLPDVMRAWELLAQLGPAAEVEVRAQGSGSAAIVRPGTDSVLSYRLRAGAPGRFALRSDVQWLLPPPVLQLEDTATVNVRVRRDRLPGPGVHVGVVEAWGRDSLVAPAFRLAATIISPRALAAESLSVRAAAGAWQRLPLLADSGRGFTVSIREPRGAPLLAFLHEPGGMPFRGGAAQIVTDPDSSAVFAADGRDVVAGVYELVIMAGPAASVAAEVVVAPAPGLVTVAVARDTVKVGVPGTPDSVTLTVVGAERGVVTSSRGSAERRIPFTLPGWVRRVQIDLRLDRDLWPLLTDFGLTLVDADGTFLKTSPQNYAFGRLEADLPSGRPDRQAEIVLLPGFAAAGAEVLWEARLTVRLYADSLPEASRFPAVPLPATAAGRPFRLPPLPWVPGDGFFPLGRVTIHARGDAWSQEFRLAPPLPPIMP